MTVPVPLAPRPGPEPPRGRQAPGTRVTVGVAPGRLVLRRLVRHRTAMVAGAVLAGVVLLATTSIGWGPLPGWWPLDHRTNHPVVNPGGAPTLDLVGGVRFGPHPMGQDALGKDVFALVMRGTQQSLLVMVVIGVLASTIGVVTGALAGYHRGRLDEVLMRFTDMVITVPVVVVGAVLGHWVGGADPLALALVLSLVSWMPMARVVRGEVLALREREFVDAARMAGAGATRIITRHLLPNAAGPIIVNATLLMAAAILLETSLSYLGFGITAPDVSLGTLVQEYQSAFATRPWLFWWPGAAIVTIALCVNVIGDGLRDALDPRRARPPRERRRWRRA